MDEKKYEAVLTFKGGPEVLEELRTDLLRSRAVSKSEGKRWRVYLFVSLTYIIALTFYFCFLGPKGHGISYFECDRIKKSSTSMQKVNVHDYCFTCQQVCVRNDTKRSELIQANKLDGTGNIQLPENDTGLTRSFPKMHRIRRDTGQMKAPIYATDFTNGKNACKFSDSLNTAEILCKMWPESVTCISYCIYGHTYREGISRTHSCSYKKDKWSAKFEECTPFVDCRVKLIAPGSLNCMDKGIHASPSCEISCERYEDKDITDMKTYECKIDGTWKPALPHCAQVKGTYLANVPKVTKHGNVTYPKTKGMK